VTSVAAIVALLAGKYMGWWWMDPLMGFVGGAVIARWAWGLMRQTASVLLDHTHDEALSRKVRAALEGEVDAHLTDLHLWQIGPGHWAAIVSVASATLREPDHYKALLSGVRQLSHITVEVHPLKTR
jgi:Co/Zn/Cd efflux system component